MAMAAAAPVSPAAASPAIRRAHTTMIGPSRPALWWLGAHTTSKVARPMSSSVVTRTLLRLVRSAIRPNTKAPMGLAMKPAANAA